MADNNLDEIYKVFSPQAPVPVEAFADKGVASAAREAAGPEPNTLDQIQSVFHPEAAPKESPSLAAPSAPSSTLANIQSVFWGKPAQAVAPSTPQAYGAPPAEDPNSPFYERVFQRFKNVWAAPDDGVAGKIWGTTQTPVVSVPDIESWMTPVVGRTEDMNPILGGITHRWPSLSLSEPAALAVWWIVAVRPS